MEKTKPPLSDAAESTKDYSDIGIVIQGPLVSRGRTGVSAQVKRRNVTEEHITDYECLENVERLYEDFEGFGRMVCMVWADEPEDLVEDLRTRIGPENVFVIEDTTKAIKPKKGVLPGNNKYRQFLSSLKGVELLENGGCPYAIKIRSDQYLDLYKLADDLKTIASLRAHFLMVPRIHVGTSSDHLADFFIGGHTKDLQKCFSAYLSAPELYRSVHTDIFYRWAYTLLGPPKLRPRMFGLKLNKNYILKAWNSLYCPARLSTFKTLIWRGDAPLVDARKTKFLEDLPPDLKVGPSMLT